MTRCVLLAWAILWAGASGAQVVPDPLLDRMRAAQVVFLGETHDNPHHHIAQAELVRALAPAALVFEMIAPDVASDLATGLVSDPVALERALSWQESGWPAFSMYYPIFKSAPEAVIFGALVPRMQARSAIEKGAAEVLGAADAALFGLDQLLPETQKTAREALQKAVHCDALPDEMLPGMVEVQRLRDARLARAALSALEATGGPVVVITGNGHARRDWGAPAALELAAPTVRIFALGQAEDGFAPDGTFDALLDAPAAERPDPCAAFR